MIDIFFNSSQKSVNIYTIINVVILIFNFLILIYLNYIAFIRRRKNERIYQQNYDLFKIIILDNIKTIIKITSDTNNEFGNVFHKCIKTISREKVIEQIQKSCKKIYDIQENYNNNILPIITCYSIDFRNELYSISESFFNDTINLVTKISVSFSHFERYQKLYEKFIKTKSTFSNNLYTLLDKFKPNIS